MSFTSINPLIVVVGVSVEEEDLGMRRNVSRSLKQIKIRNGSQTIHTRRKVFVTHMVS